MSLLNQNKKGKDKNKNQSNQTKGSKFIQSGGTNTKGASSAKKQRTGGTRGS